MSDTLAIEGEIEAMEGLHALLTTNEELAVARMQQIRRSVLKTRRFMDEIIDVFREVRLSQAKYVDLLYQKRQRGWLLRQASLFAGKDGANGNQAGLSEQELRPAAVLLSANDRLSGQIVSQVFDDFIKHVELTKSHPIIMGRAGRTMYEELLETSRISEKADYYDLPGDRDITLADVRPLVDTLAQYGEVRVFYARFINLVSQVPSASQLADSPLKVFSEKQNQETAKPQESAALYVFEPSLERVVEIFDNQILTALLTQLATEAQLGLLGSRVTNLERSQQLVEVYLQALEQKKKNVSRAETGQDQQERLAGIALWS